MYKRAVLASAALMASTALAGTPGSAVVVNACTYPVYLSAVPAAGGGFTEIDKTLQPKDSFTQQWTELSNGDGWSIKLSKSQSLANILQYEYTFHNDGIIWFDLSCVNGNPWDGDWEVSSAGTTCTPKQSFYRFDTDDAFGMQSCESDSTITVTLCSGESQADEIVSSVQAATTAAVAPTPTPQTTTQTPVAAPTTPSTTHTEAATVSSHPLGFNGGQFYNADVAKDVTTPTPTTFATATTAAMVNEDGDVVTEVVTVIETAIAYETYVPGKRHVHHPNHPHFR